MDKQICPECGAIGRTCTDDFHQMLYWEAEFPPLGEVHHLMVLCYHLQHPSLYSPQTLKDGIWMLDDFLSGTTPAEMRWKMRAAVDSGRRTHKITGTPESHGAYDRPMAWTKTAADVVAGGADHYIENVWDWARSVQATLQEANAK